MIDQRWLILVVLFVARSSFGYQFQSVASAAPLIEAELHIGYAAIGTLIGLYTIPGAFLSVPGGMLGARFGDRTIAVTGLVLMIGGGLLMCTGDTVLPLTAGRLISGTGAVLFSLVLNKMIIDWFAGREIVFAMGTLLSSWPFGIALGLMVQGRIAESFGWRTGMAIAALCPCSLRASSATNELLMGGLERAMSATTRIRLFGSSWAVSVICAAQKSARSRPMRWAMMRVPARRSAQRIADAYIGAKGPRLDVMFFPLADHNYRWRSETGGRFAWPRTVPDYPVRLIDWVVEASKPCACHISDEPPGASP